MPSNSGFRRICYENDFKVAWPPPIGACKINGLPGSSAADLPVAIAISECHLSQLG